MSFRGDHFSVPTKTVIRNVFWNSITSCLLIFHPIIFHPPPNELSNLVIENMEEEEGEKWLGEKW